MVRLQTVAIPHLPNRICLEVLDVLNGLRVIMRRSLPANVERSLNNIVPVLWDPSRIPEMMTYVNAVPSRFAAFS